MKEESTHEENAMPELDPRLIRMQSRANLVERMTAIVKQELGRNQTEADEGRADLARAEVLMDMGILLADMTQIMVADNHRDMGAVLKGAFAGLPVTLEGGTDALASAIASGEKPQGSTPGFTREQVVVACYAYRILTDQTEEDEDVMSIVDAIEKGQELSRQRNSGIITGILNEIEHGGPF